MTGQALRVYRFGTRVWMHSDPELQPVVREAQSAVMRLGGGDGLNFLGQRDRD